MKSKFDPDAKITEKQYWCPKCGAPTFSNQVAVWCSQNKDLEEGDCDYQLMSG